jgi:HNH endonuclease
VRSEKAEDGTLLDVRDTRSATQRRADALGVISKLALGVKDKGSTGGGVGGSGGGGGSERYKIVLHADAETLAEARATDPATPAPATPEPATPRPGRPSAPAEQSGPAEPAGPAPDAPPRRRGRVPSPLAEFGSGGLVDPQFLAQFSCDSTLQAAFLSPSGAILDLGREVRTITPAQRKALVARDRGCVIPGCSAPASWCDGHHVRWWRHGGRTDITNLALLCGRHHTAVHSGIWAIVMRDGVPWVIPPDWVDHERRPIRNTYFDDAAVMHRLGTQLRGQQLGLSLGRNEGPVPPEAPEFQPPETQPPETQPPETQPPET